MAKAILCLNITTAKYKPCQPVTDNLFDLFLLAMRLVNEEFHGFELPKEKQTIKSNYEFGIYFAIVRKRSKIGCSYTNMYKRVKHQIPNFDTSNAVCLMNPDQVQEMIPDWIVEKTIELELPGLQFHESHEEKLECAIKTFWAEFLCYACTNCPPGIVGERFLEVPSARVSRAFEPLFGDAFNQRALDILASKKTFSFLQTWPTVCHILAALAKKGDKTLQQRLAMLGRKHEYPKKYMYVESFGEENVGGVFDATNENPTVTLCEELVKKIEEIISDCDDLEDLSTDDKKSIRDLIQEYVGNTQDKVFDTYIRPDDNCLGAAGIEKFESLFDDIQNLPSEDDHRREEHCVVVERCLLEAMEKVDPEWMDNNLDNKIDLGKNMYLCTHIDSGYTLLVVPSFFLLVAEKTQNEQRMRNLESLVHLLKYLFVAGNIDGDRYDEQTRLLKSYAMRLNLNLDGDEEEEDRSYREARVRL